MRRSFLPRIAGMSLLAALFLPVSGFAQDGGAWWDGFGDSGTDIYVFGMVPYGDRLAVAGHFTEAGGKPANRVALWDGDNWAPVGQGMSGTGVYALTVYRGDLIAAGLFDEADGLPVNNVARWDGATWRPLGEGTDDLIWAMTVYHDELYIGGVFTTAGEVHSPYLARWNGVEWRDVGGGLVGEPGFVTGAFALGRWDGKLVVGGGFLYAGGGLSRNIALWDGTGWSPVGGGTNGLVYATGSYQGDLILGGAFSQAAGLSAKRIARWDGSQWNALGSGVNGGDHAVSALIEYEGELVAGGVFLEAGGVEAPHIAAWDGAGWRPLGAGTNGAVRTLREWGGSLYAGGDFTRAGGVASWYLGRWDASASEVENPDGSGICLPGGLCDQDLGDPLADVRLLAAFPNPFRDRVGFAFSMPEPRDAHITIHDLRGRRVAVVPTGVLNAGWNVAEWSARDASGRRVAPGIYFARLQALGKTRTVKILCAP